MVEAKQNVLVERGRLSDIFGTPKECFDFLTLEVGYHLAPRPYTDMEMMAAIWDGSRKAVMSKDVCSRRIPQVKSLRTDDIITFLKLHGSEKYLNPPKKKKVSEKWHRPTLCEVGSLSVSPS
jgi:hypothetical protein